MALATSPEDAVITSANARSPCGVGCSAASASTASEACLSPSRQAATAAWNATSGCSLLIACRACSSRSTRPNSPAARNAAARTKGCSAASPSCNTRPGSTWCIRQAAKPRERRAGSADTNSVRTTPCKSAADTQPKADATPRAASGSVGTSASTCSISASSRDSSARTASANTSPQPGRSSAARQSLLPYSPATAKPSKCAAMRSSSRPRCKSPTCGARTRTLRT